MPSPDTVAAPRRRLPPEVRRRELVEAAIRLMGQRPVDQVSVDDITSAAGVSRALFYRYFAGPGELFLEAMRVAVDGLVERLAQAVGGSPAEQLRAGLAAFADFAEVNAPSYIALLRNGSVLATAKTDAIVDEVRRAAAGQVLGQLDEPASALTTLTAHCWVATVEGTMLTWLQERALPRGELEDWLVAQLLGMLATTSRWDPAAGRLRDRLSA